MTAAQSYSPDDALTDSVDLPDPSRHLKVYVATLPPFTGTHTATQESARELVNAYVLGDVGAYLQGYADGVIDFAAAVSTGADDVSDTVKDADLTGALPNDAYYFDLAQQYLAQVDLSDVDPGADPIAFWDFGYMDGDTVPDHGNGTGVSRTTHDGSLHDVATGTGRLLGSSAGTFNGTSSYANSSLAVNTARSFTVTAWVRLTDTTTDRAIYTRDATGYASLYLQYRAGDGNWIAQMPSSTSGTPTWQTAISAQPAQTGLWTHLAVVYDATVQSLTIYVNGNGTAAPATVASFNDPTQGSLIGRSSAAWFAGDIAEIKVWGRTLSEPEVDVQAAPVQVLGWQLDESAGTTAGDSTPYSHDGTLQSGATWVPGRTTDPRDYAVHLDGTSGTVDATAPVLRTDQSFTVAAWARISSTTGSRTVITQESTHGASFMLQYNGSCVCWAFVTEDSDIVNPTTRLSMSPPNSVVYDKWTHIAGVYDATAKTLSLYVNGILAGTPTAAPSTYQAAGSFAAGRTRWADALTDWFPGDIDNIRAYQGALSATDIKALATS